MSGINMNAIGGNIQRAMGQAVGTMKQMGQMATQFEQIQKIVAMVQGGGNPMPSAAAEQKNWQRITITL